MRRRLISMGFNKEKSSFFDSEKKTWKIPRKSKEQGFPEQIILRTTLWDTTSGNFSSQLSLPQLNPFTHKSFKRKKKEGGIKRKKKRKKKNRNGNELQLKFLLKECDIVSKK